jgi:hypothetical protein
MPSDHPHLVKNSKHKPCTGCGGVHLYLTRISPDATCGTPVAFSPAKALQVARLAANGAEDVVPIPDDTVVVMDDSARRLPRGEGPTLQLAQFSYTERSA